jgi:hypothetical protein
MINPWSEFMYTPKTCLLPFIFFAAVSLGTSGNSHAADHAAPAGQMCPEGAYVIGFDSESNIICASLRNNAADPVEVYDEVNIEVQDTTETQSVQPKPVEQAVLAQPVIVSRTQILTITDVEPPNVVFGKHELAITVIGTGFNSDSVIIFAGKSYPTSVNASGTRLEATVTIGKLSFGAHPIKVSNGQGKEVVLKKALEIF